MASEGERRLQDVGELAVQIGAFIIGAALLGLCAGVLFGRRSGAKRAARRFDMQAPAEAPVVRATRVVVRPDPALFAENERLRDRLIIVYQRALDLEAQLAALTIGDEPGGNTHDESRDVSSDGSGSSSDVSDDPSAALGLVPNA